MMDVDTTFNVHSDAGGCDPDIASPTLRLFHRILWNKPLPSGQIFELTSNKGGAYLYHNSELGEFFLGSDAITHSYRNHKRKKWLTMQIQDEVDELFDRGSTIGSFVIFPNRRVDRKHTINQARGVNSLIDDRFDLTLECIRLFYLKKRSPLYDTLLRYRGFFDLFTDFQGYIEFFLLDDLIDENRNVKFYLPFDNFSSRPLFSCIDDYLTYKESVTAFIESRNERIKKIAKIKDSASVAANIGLPQPGPKME
jgi:hypothetical protein